jgi:ankyrin repeat protein
MLLDAGVDANATYRHDLTALMWAAGYGKADTVRLLLARGADPARRDDRGKTAGDIARDGRYADVAALLERKEERDERKEETR